MNALLIIVGLPLLFSFLLSILLNQRVAQLLPISYLSATLWLYFFGIADKFQLGLNLLIPVFFIVTLLAIKNKRKTLPDKNKSRELISPAVLIFLALSTWTFSHTESLKFYQWDEFSHWGSAVKSLYFFNQLSPFAPVDVAFPEYVPGLTIFADLIIEGNGYWQESLVYWSYQLLIFSILAAMISKIDWKSFSLAIFSVAAILTSSVIFFDTFQTVYADPLLGILYGYALLLASSRSIIRNKTFLFNFTVIVTFIGIVKDVGIFFTITSSAILLVNYVISAKENSLNFRKFLIEFFSIATVILLPTLIVKRVWSHALKINDVYPGRELFSVISGMRETSFSGLKDLNIDYSEEVISRFILRSTELSLTTNNSLTISPMVWAIIFSVLLISANYGGIGKYAIARKITFTLVIILGLFGYMAALLLSYLILFTPAESLNLASYERYVSTYFAGLAIYISGRMISQVSAGYLNSVKLILPLLWVSFLLFQSAPQRVIEYVQNPMPQATEVRKNLEVQSWLISEMSLPAETKVWVITQHKAGFEFYFINYELLPASVGKIPFSIGSKFGPEDIWTDPTYTPEKWSEALEGFDYVFVNNVSETFVSEFGVMFQDVDSLENIGFYKVTDGPIYKSLVKVK
jgi:hypothetical protein